MCKNSIPANAHNGVVAGENAKVMTEEILKGFVEEATPEEFFSNPKSDRAKDFLSKVL